MEIRWLLKPPKMKTTNNKEEKNPNLKKVGGLRGKLLKAVFGCVGFPLHKPYPYSKDIGLRIPLFGWYLRCLVILFFTSYCPTQKMRPHSKKEKSAFSKAHQFWMVSIPQKESWPFRYFEDPKHPCVLIEVHSPFTTRVPVVIVHKLGA